MKAVTALLADCGWGCAMGKANSGGGSGSGGRSSNGSGRSSNGSGNRDGSSNGSGRSGRSETGKGSSNGSGKSSGGNGISKGSGRSLIGSKGSVKRSGGSSGNGMSNGSGSGGGSYCMPPKPCRVPRHANTRNNKINALCLSLIAMLLLEDHGFAQEGARIDRAGVQTGGGERGRAGERQSADVHHSLGLQQVVAREGHVGQRRGRDCETRRTRRRHADELAGGVRRQVHAAPEDDHGLAGGRAAPIHREALAARNGGCLGAVAPGGRRGESEIRRNGPDVRSAGTGERETTRVEEQRGR